MIALGDAAALGLLAAIVATVIGAVLLALRRVRERLVWSAVVALFALAALLLLGAEDLLFRQFFGVIIALTAVVCALVLLAGGFIGARRKP